MVVNFSSIRFFVYCIFLTFLFRHFEVDLYVGLSPEEAKLVGTIHNRRCSIKTEFPGN